ncbi:MAG: sigma-70 family RNA polymerase sigma factor [Actinobacteria bacterium]|nr:sigma-70 family RNA polymerase sigma factor [Actinomycetota bacterium]MBV9933352.1 sigma-70 family RNA polymerase sigma factor [Actinomycetota bacterium]
MDGTLSYQLPAEPMVADTHTELRVTTDHSFVAFYAEERDGVVRALALTLGDVHLAAEATDEAMVRAYQRWDRIGGYDNPAGWVYRVGLNWATSVLRRVRRAPKPHAEVDPTDIESVAEPSVRDALARLNVSQRSVVVCRFYLGLSEAETAAALKTRPGTVKSRLHRALRTLQSDLHHLKPDGPEEHA